ncbi:MAG: hypothetical protein HYZ29_29995 [Myxococcales bacterium]|nr:hypothetical protein [Myxococcales bacterium]
MNCRPLVLVASLVTAGCGNDADPLDHYWDSKACKLDPGGACEAYLLRQAPSAALVLQPSSSKTGGIGAPNPQAPVFRLVLSPEQNPATVPLVSGAPTQPAPRRVDAGQAFFMYSKGFVDDSEWYVAEGTLELAQLDIHTDRSADRERVDLEVTLTLGTLSHPTDADAAGYSGMTIHLVASDPD